MEPSSGPPARAGARFTGPCSMRWAPPGRSMGTGSTARPIPRSCASCWSSRPIGGSVLPANGDPSIGPAVCRRYVELLTVELEKPSQATKIYPGITELLSALEPYEADGRALVGLLTGNVQHGAALKLRSAGLDPARFTVGAFGSDSHHRPDLPAVAARRAAQQAGRPFSGAEIVIVGDTPDDVACCKPMGARSVGVATGFYDVAALRSAGATHVFRDLGDTHAVLQALFS